MANAYTQDIILDADGKPVLDALTLVRNFMSEIQKAVTGIGVTTVEDAKKWQQALALNLKMLKQAESDLKTLQSDRQNRQKGFADAEANAKKIAAAEVRADREANKQKLIEAKVTYGEKARIAREEANIEKQLAKEIAEFEKSQDRAAIASAKEVAAARREAATAAVTAKAKGITNTDDARAAKAASDARLNLLRRERETVAANDADAARGIANRIAVEKALGTALDGTIRKLNQQAEADRRAQEAATRRLQGQLPAANRLLAPANVRDEVNRSGDPRSTLVGYQFEQEVARQRLQAAIGDRNATLEQVTAARQRLELANANVAAAKRLVQEEEKLVQIEQRLANTTRLEQQKAQLALAGQYAREQISALGPKEAIRRAVEATALAEQRLATASAEHVASARMELELAKAQQAQTEKQGRGGPLSSILSPGYGVAAFARTSVYGLAAGAAYSVFNGIQGGVGQVVQMEDELAKLQAIAGATEPQLQQIRAAIYDIGTTSRFSVVDLAKISQTLAQAGVTAGDMRSVLESVTTLATASGSTPDEAVNLVTSALGSFQLQASEAARVADLMTSALNRTKLTVQQTGQAIQYVGATAYEQNISLETLLATVGAIAQAGVRSGSTIGTGFRQFLVDLANPSEKLTTQLKLLKLSAADVDVSVRGLPAVLETLQKAGFGAGQAYAGLETRAAAFYLVAKNNVDIMDQLQLSFANSGAAAVANERAMNSLTAQWQRFKNILGEGLSNSLEGPMNIFKNILTAISDRLEESKRIAQDLKNKNAQGTAAWYEKDMGPAAEDVLRRTFNLIGLAGTAGMSNTIGGQNVNGLTGEGKGFGDWLDSWTKKADGATEASERLATQVAETTDAVDKQTGKISELDKEMARLAVQKESLRNNDVRSSAEIATLTSRFEGLAVFLTNTGNRYDDLTQAAQRYRLEQMKLLNTDLTAQGAALQIQTADAQTRQRSTIAGLKGNSSLMSQLTPQERGALTALQNGGTNQRAQAILADAVKRFTDNDPRNGAFNRELANQLNQVVQAVGTVATNTSQQNIIATRTADNTAAMTREGRKVTGDTAAVQTLVTQLGSAEGADKVRLGRQGLAQVNALDKYINGLLANKGIQGANRNFLQNALTDVGSLRQQINATLAPTKAEDREAKAAERAADKAAKLVTQQDIDRIGLALGLKLGSGPRTAEEQERLHARGVTPARGFGPRQSNHVGGVARDFSVRGLSDAEAERYAATMRAQYRAAGIEAQVKYERGGRNDGTGRHIHVGARKGATRRADRTEENEDKYNVELARAQIALDEADLTTKLKEVARATSKETFDTSVAAAKAALDKVNGQLKDAALDELAASGIAPGSPQFNARMLQVEQTISQNVEDFNQKVTDAIIKSVKKQTDAAATAFDTATQGATSSLQIAQSQLSGLDAYSLRNKVPDYVKSLAGDRVAMAQENVAKAQYNALPAQISAQQQAMDTLRGTIGSVGVNPEVVNAQLAQMNVELQKLMANREALGAQLNAGGLLPSNFSDGLDKAIQAYRQANDLNQTFSQSLIMNLGGALDTVNSGLTTMFTSILDGSQTALQAFGNFAKGVMQWMVQLAAKAVATQVFNLLLNTIGGAFGAKAAAPAGGTTTATPGGGGAWVFNGGGVGDDGKIYRRQGGSVENGDVSKDSVDAKLARGEWVVQKKAVDSVGNKFMARLNQHGAKALDSLQAVPQLDMRNHTETNVYVVPPDQQPTLGPNDVRVILNDELMNGDGKRLVQHIASDR